jgi:hypothetical protein
MHDYRNNDQTIIHLVDGVGNVTSEILAPEDFIFRNPYNINMDRVFMVNTEPMTLDIFFSIAQKLIQDAQEKDDILPDKLVRLVEEYPPENMDEYGNEVITFKVIERKPGMMNTKGTDRPHRKATYSHQEIRPNMPNKIITVESRPVDHVIEFNCWATSNKLANRRAIWLEKLFINSAFAFELKGAERFFWKERLSDNYMNINGQRVFSRPIRFFLRFREFDAKAYAVIRQALIDLKILPPKN